MTKNPILVTGCAGFIGMATVKSLLSQGEHVIGLDNLNDYYDPRLKQDRLQQLVHPNFVFFKQDLLDQPRLKELWHHYQPHRVVHLAAQAGVRHSIDNPYTYIDNNITGFLTILEFCRQQPGFQHVVYASSSSVYGDNNLYPAEEEQSTTLPASLYAATKAANELMAQSYASLYQLPVTGLRFFTVYGPWGRPDMAYFKFTKAISDGQPIDVYNHGEMSRDFTYIDDVVAGIIRALAQPPVIEKEQRHPLYNLGNDNPCSLMTLVNLIEQALGRRAEINFLPQQLGDVTATCADITKAQRALGYAPVTTFPAGIANFIEWYQDYFALRL